MSRSGVRWVEPIFWLQAYAGGPLRLYYDPMNSLKDETERIELNRAKDHVAERLSTQTLTSVCFYLVLGF